MYCCYSPYPCPGSGNRTIPSVAWFHPCSFPFLIIKFIYRLNIIESFALTLIAIFIILIGDLAVQALVVNILHIDLMATNRIVYIITANCLFLLFTFLFIGIKQLFRRQTITKMNIKLFFWVCVIFILLISNINIFFYFQTRTVSPASVIMFNLVAFGIYFFICLFLIFIYFTSNNQKLLLDQQTKEYEQLIEYTGIIENLYENIRGQKHDFMNVLFSIKGYIDNGQWGDLKNYFYHSILHGYEETHSSDFRLR